MAVLLAVGSQNSAGPLPVLILRPDKTWKTKVQEVEVKPRKAFTNQELLVLVKESLPSDEELQNLQFLE